MRLSVLIVIGRRPAGRRCFPRRLAGIVETLGDYYVDPHNVPALQSACSIEPATPCGRAEPHPAPIRIP